VESGELLNEAVIREVQEETGLQVIIDRLVGVYRRVPKNTIVFSFICRIVGGETFSQMSPMRHCTFMSTIYPLIHLQHTLKEYMMR